MYLLQIMAESNTPTEMAERNNPEMAETKTEMVQSIETYLDEGPLCQNEKVNEM